MDSNPRRDRSEIDGRPFSLVIEFSFAMDAHLRRIAHIRTSDFSAHAHTAKLHAVHERAATRLKRMTVNAVIEAAEATSLREQLSRFVAAGSTEVTVHDEKLLEEMARILPAGFPVYVANTPKTSPDDVVRVALRLQRLGLTASPHVIARRVADAARLRERLRTLAAAGVQQVLLVAGDMAIPNGAFSSTVELLESGVVQEAGIRRVGVAGHPEGHPVVPDDVLWQALERKQAIAREAGLTMHIATQFGFDARTLGGFEAQLRARGVDLPIHAGVAGPTPFTRLLRYAAHCGVGASLRAVAGNALSLGRLPHLVTRSDEMLVGVYRAKQAIRDSRIFAPHFFAFGGVLETARWLRAVIAGSFELDSAERGFSIKT
ncbi:MAG TPA: methylenetetrahydrofolate reductase [Steroidobacteraceae bacterium]|nr:methylenetetrahydrofolate reductase [Steroidobacteraceae bacterium]